MQTNFKQMRYSRRRRLRLQSFGWQQSIVLHFISNLQMGARSIIITKTNSTNWHISRQSADTGCHQPASNIHIATGTLWWWHKLQTHFTAVRCNQVSLPPSLLHRYMSTTKYLNKGLRTVGGLSGHLPNVDTAAWHTICTSPSTYLGQDHCSVRSMLRQATSAPKHQALK